MMLDIDINKKYVDLNRIPTEDSPVLSSKNVRAINGPTLTEIPREPLFPPMLGETSSPPQKRRGQKRLQDVPVGWVVNECVRLSGKSAGKKEKYFIEPGTGKKFRSMPAVSRHLGIADSMPPQK